MVQVEIVCEYHPIELQRKINIVLKRLDIKHQEIIGINFFEADGYCGDSEDRRNNRQKYAAILYQPTSTEQ